MGATSTEDVIEFTPPEVENFEVELRKDSQGLGITIAGYVCERGNFTIETIWFVW